MKGFDYSMFYTRDEVNGEYHAAEGFEECEVRHYKKGEHIAMQGDRVRALTITVEGSVSVEIVVESGLVVRTTHHAAPTIIGAMAIFSKEGRYIADTIAREEVVALSFSRHDIERRMQQSLNFMYNFVSFITSRVEALSSHIAILTQRNIKAKLAYYILQCSDGKEYRFNKKIVEIAAYIAVERPSISRVLAQMVAEGLITHKNGSGRILAPRALKNLTEV